MSAVVTLVIYLSFADAADPRTRALVDSAREILGKDVQVTLRTAAAQVRDAELVKLAPDAAAVADVAWLGSDHRLAHVRCYVTSFQRIIERDVAFDEDSDIAQRERMLGFVIAALLPATGDASERLPGATPLSSNADSPHTHATSPADDLPASSLPPSPRFVGMAEVVGLGATGVRGSASTFGASLAARWLFARTLALRVAGGLRRGDIPEASATSEVDFLGAGLAFELPLSDSSSVALGGRTSALLLREQVMHLSADDREPDRKSRVLPGADAYFEGAWHFSAGAGLLLGLGSELAFGRTDVYVKNNKVTNIPPLRVLVELGIQAKF